MGAIAQSAGSAQPRSGPRSGPLKGRAKSSRPQLKIEGFGPHHGPHQNQQSIGSHRKDPGSHPHAAQPLDGSTSRECTINRCRVRR